MSSRTAARHPPVLLKKLLCSPRAARAPKETFSANLRALPLRHTVYCVMSGPGVGRRSAGLMAWRSWPGQGAGFGWLDKRLASLDSPRSGDRHLPPRGVPMWWLANYSAFPRRGMELVPATGLAAESIHSRGRLPPFKPLPAQRLSRSYRRLLQLLQAVFGEIQPMASTLARLASEAGQRHCPADQSIGGRSRSLQQGPIRRQQRPCSLAVRTLPGKKALDAPGGFAQARPRSVPPGLGWYDGGSGAPAEQARQLALRPGGGKARCVPRPADTRAASPTGFAAARP